MKIDGKKWKAPQQRKWKHRFFHAGGCPAGDLKQRRRFVRLACRVRELRHRRSPSHPQESTTALMYSIYINHQRKTEVENTHTKTSHTPMKPKLSGWKWPWDGTSNVGMLEKFSRTALRLVWGELSPDIPRIVMMIIWVCKNIKEHPEKEFSGDSLRLLPSSARGLGTVRIRNLGRIAAHVMDHSSPFLKRCQHPPRRRPRDLEWGKHSSQPKREIWNMW